MAPATHSAADEEKFMQDLLSGLGDDFFSAVPSPDPSPQKLRQNPQKSPRKPQLPATPRRSQKKESVPPSSLVFSTKIEDVDVQALVEGAEDWDWNDMDSDFMTPKKCKGVESRRQPSPLKSSIRHTNNLRDIGATCTRFIVERITESEVGVRFSKKLTVKIDRATERRTVILYDDWVETDVRVGDIINVIGEFTPFSPSSSIVASTIDVTAKSNLLIHHPDILITATALSNALQCQRRPLLTSLVRSASDVTPSLVWGNMLHEVMQSCMYEGRWEESWIDERISEVVRKSLDELVKIGFGIEQACIEVKKRAKGLHAFSERYMSDTPKPEAILTNTRATQTARPSLLAISRLQDVEEDIWSPTYGLKGKIDATVYAHISDPAPLSPFSLPPTITSGPTPFEIKTGLSSSTMEHRAQTMLYTLLASERYVTPVDSGLLYYTQTDEVVRVPRGWNELRGLIGVRNIMAGYMMRRSNLPAKREGKSDLPDMEGEPFLPPTIDNARVCNRCFVTDTCMLYRKAVENVDDTDSSIADIYALKTAHLTPSQGAFFKQWEALLSLEESDIVRFKKELWTMGAKEREGKGRCFAGMVIDSLFISSSPLPSEGIQADPTRANKIHRFTYKFVRSANTARTPLPFSSLLSGHMNIGDAITVSIEPDLLALARGFIVDLMPQAVVVGVDHKISLDDMRERLKLKDPDMEDVIFRIDRDELFGGMGRVRDNLARLFYADGDTRRLELVVDLRAPVFDLDAIVKFAQTVPSYPSATKNLNPNQLQAMNKVLSAQDYALILGMPGTGKTTVIASLIRVLVGMGKTVLLTSYTHSAVDTILLKLKDKEDGFGVLRLGNVDKVHSDVRKYSLTAKGTATTIEQLEQQIMTPQVVATTCLSIDHALFSRRTFDYCIVDEASQITLPTCLGPLRFAEIFVLVGDHFQLPPLVRSTSARKGGLDVSLFRRLSDAHPNAVVDLTYQYRMNEDIMLLSNKLIYNDRLRCGSEAIAKAGLVLPDTSLVQSLHRGQDEKCHKDGCWIERLLDASCKAVFVDTDQLPAPDSLAGDLVQNEGEASLVHQLTEILIRSGVTEDQIGIISLYRQQIKLIGHLLGSRKSVEILTADRSQGRDKECIIISMVRSNDAGNLGVLMKDWRRINVSFTRARSKLIIFGSRKTLQSDPLLSDFLDLMESQNWILQLPHGADKAHLHLMQSSPCTSAGSSPSGKRTLEQTDDYERKENGPARKVKKIMAEEGLLKGRYVLQDLVNGDQ